MKIYLAHNFVAREVLGATVRLLEAIGHEVTSRWITDDEHVKANSSQQNALDDLEDIRKADALLLFINQYGSSPGRGKYIELGYALGIGKKCYIIGYNMGCVFYSLPEIIHIKNFTELEGFLK